MEQMSESTDIAYSANAGGVYATIYEEAQGTTLRFGNNCRRSVQMSLAEEMVTCIPVLPWMMAVKEFSSTIKPLT